MILRTMGLALLIAGLTLRTDAAAQSSLYVPNLDWA
jgi:hypothetical protein